MSKPYNISTGLYNYGFRDYKPTAARFTTVDPIRDGNNWFAYVNNDPVNYIDLWGLCSSDNFNKNDYLYFFEHPGITITAIQPTTGTTSTAKRGPHLPTYKNAFNLDFGIDYLILARANIKDGHYGWAAVMYLDATCELIYNLLAVYAGANLISSAGSLIINIGTGIHQGIKKIQRVTQSTQNQMPKISNNINRNNIGSRSNPLTKGNPNETLVERNINGTVRRVTQFDSNGNFLREIRPKGSHGTNGPTVKEATFNTNPNTGQIFQNKPNYRPATNAEIDLLR